ncbi:hypothetical protein SGPA1_40806 [Streptomyces misionensis JCM 4497]
MRGRGRRELRERHPGPALRLQRHRGPVLDGRLGRHDPGARQVPGRHRPGHGGRLDGPAVGLHGRGQPEVDGHRGARHRQPTGEQVPGRHREQLGQRDTAADLVLHRWGQPEVDGRLSGPLSAASRCTCRHRPSGPRPGRRGRGW